MSKSAFQALEGLKHMKASKVKASPTSIPWTILEGTYDFKSRNLDVLLQFLFIVNSKGVSSLPQRASIFFNRTNLALDREPFKMSAVEAQYDCRLFFAPSNC